MHLVFKDIDSIIAEHIECSNDFRNLLLVNKYCNKLVYDNPLFKEWKFLFSKGKINFVNACKYGCLEICKYLLIKDNIHIDNNYTFRPSYNNDNLEEPKWLRQLEGNIDICHYINELFIWSRGNGNIEMIKWLFQLTFICQLRNSKVVD